MGQQVMRHGHQCYSTLTESYPRAFNPGGTTMGLLPHIASRSEDHGADKVGRWMLVQLTGKRSKSILIITAYRVSQTYPSEVGCSTAYMQQYRALLKENISQKKTKHKILTDLDTFIATWRDHNDHSSVIVMMSGNTDSCNPHLKVLITDATLYDVIKHYSPELINQITYVNGRKRIDYILVSEYIHIPSIGSGHTPYGPPLHIRSHRVYWDIPYDALFQSRLIGPRIPQICLQLDRKRII